MMGLLTEGVMIFLGGMLLGTAIGFFLALGRFMRTERPTIELRVTPELAERLSSGVVHEWLEARGLTWMPKGQDFRPKVKS